MLIAAMCSGGACFALLSGLERRWDMSKLIVRLLLSLIRSQDWMLKHDLDSLQGHNAFSLGPGL